MVTFIVNAIKIIFLLGFLVLIHEGGHFLVAKLCKIKVNEFAIGFGPTLLSKTKEETKYALHLIPLGGFVSLEGEEEHSDKEGSFTNASTIKKIAILIAGGTVNIIFGLLVYFIIMASSSNFSSNTVQETMEGLAAQSAGIIQGDKILEINHQEVRNSRDVNRYLSKIHGEEMEITLERNSEILTINLIPTKIENEGSSYYYLGIVFEKVNPDLLTRVQYAEDNTRELLKSLGDGIKQLITGKSSINQMVGIVGISDVVVKTSGIYEYLYMLALISVSLGFTNLLPFPPLDGGKVVIHLIEGLRHKSISEDLNLKIQTLGFAIIIALSIYITYKDILRIL